MQNSPYKNTYSSDISATYKFTYQVFRSLKNKFLIKNGFFASNYALLHKILLRFLYYNYCQKSWSLPATPYRQAKHSQTPFIFIFVILPVTKNSMEIFFSLKQDS